jgi:DNA polymerase III epsilon subunit-like protein
MKYLAVDFETSGTDAGQHAPVSLGLAIMEGETVLASNEWVFGPPKDKNGKISRAYDVRALSISGVTWKKIQESPSMSVQLKAIKTWVNENGASLLPRVAFNASFDFGFWQTMLFLCGSWDRGTFNIPQSPVIGTWECVMELAKSKLSLPDYKLDTVAAHFGMARASDEHGALEDAIIAGRLLARLKEPTTA